MEEKESLSRGAKYLIPCWAQSAAKLQQQLLERLWAGSEAAEMGLGAAAPGVTLQHTGTRGATQGLCEHKGLFIPQKLRPCPLRPPSTGGVSRVWAAPAVLGSIAVPKTVPPAPSPTGPCHCHPAKVTHGPAAPELCAFG